MKKIILSIALGFVTAVTFAQVTNKPVAPARDTVKARPAKPGKIRIIDGDSINSARSIVQNIAQAKNYSTLSEAIRAAKLIQTLNTGPLTVFAPSNAAFAKLKAGMLDTLLKPNHVLDLTALLTYHTIPGKLTIKELTKRIKDGKGQTTLITLSGSKITAAIDTNRNVVLTDEFGGKSVVGEFDVEQMNGLIHTINAVLVPKNKLI